MLEKVLSFSKIVKQFRESRTEKMVVNKFLEEIPIEDAIIIPEGMTNGDVMRAVFPNAKFTHKDSANGKGFTEVFGVDSWVTHQFYDDWWDSAYMGGGSSADERHERA